MGPESYYIGIIDFQQQFDWDKKLERFFKIHILRKDPRGLSCAEPEFYKNRFLDRIDELLRIDDDSVDYSSDADLGRASGFGDSISEA